MRRLRRFDADVDELLGGFRGPDALLPDGELITYKSLRLMRDRAGGDGEVVLVCKEPEDDAERFRYFVIVGMLTWGTPDVNRRTREVVETRQLARRPIHGELDEIRAWLDEIDDVDVEDLPEKRRKKDPRPKDWPELESTERAPRSERIERFRRMRGVSSDRGPLGEAIRSLLGVETSTSRSALIFDEMGTLGDEQRPTEISKIWCDARKEGIVDARRIGPLDDVEGGSEP